MWKKALQLFQLGLTERLTHLLRFLHPRSFGMKLKNFKSILLDEADAMTSDAQFALRRVIEKYTKYARFCLICNDFSKIIPTLQSRSTRFRSAPLSQNQIRGRLLEVAQVENCQMTPEGQLKAILSLSGGDDMRRVLNLLKSTAMSATK
jgi:replication factor C subunit 3/5